MMTIYFAVLQRSLNPSFINIWINGNSQRELITEKRLLEFLSKDAPELIIPLKETVLRNNSFYLIDFVQKRIYHLSSSSFNEDQTLKESIYEEYKIEAYNLDMNAKLNENVRFENLLNQLSNLSKNQSSSVPQSQDSYLQSWLNSIFSPLLHRWQRQNIKMERKNTGTGWKIRNRL